VKGLPGRGQLPRTVARGTGGPRAGAWAAAAVALALAACGQGGAVPPPSGAPGPPGQPGGPALEVDNAGKRFVVVNVLTGTAVRLSVAVSNLRGSLYTSLRVALVARATGLVPGLGPLDLQVARAPDLKCALVPTGHVAAPSSAGWSVEYDVDPGTGNPAFDLPASGQRGPVCVEVRFVRPGVTGAGVTLEGHVFVYRDANPANGRYDVGGDTVLSRPPADNPVEVTLAPLGFRP
jgi:hypothetical protein